MQKKLVSIIVWLVACLMFHHVQPMELFDAELYQAAGSGDTARLEERLRTGAVLDAARSDDGETALHNAARQGQVAVVQKLIERGADVSKENRKGQTALSIARDAYKQAVVNSDLHRQVVYTEIIHAFTGNVAMADQELLRSLILENHMKLERDLGNGANPNVRSAGKNGIIPLQYVVKSFPSNLVLKSIKLLVDKGANVAAQDDSGNTALSRAIHRGDVEAVQLLLTLKADPNQKAFKGYSPLMQAITFGHKDLEADVHEIIEALIKHGALAREVDEEGRTPLLVAVEKGNIPAVKLLLAHGADVTVASLDNDTPLTSALERGNLPIVQLLLERGADLAAKNRLGETVAQIVARKQLTTPEWQLVIGTKVGIAEPQNPAEPKKAEEQQLPPLPPKRVVQPAKAMPQPPSELEETLEELTEVLRALEQQLTL